MATKTAGWTDVAGLREASLKSWERGEMLRELLAPTGMYPRRRVLKAPTAGELRQQFAHVRSWAGALHDGAKHYRVESKSMGHQSVGANEVPQAVWFQSLEDELAFVGKSRDAATFAKRVRQIEGVEPGIRVWVMAKPQRFLALSEDAERVVTVARWLANHPGSGIYLRQIAIRDVDTKFIERHLSAIDELAAVLAGQGTPRNSSVKSFKLRHGLVSEPETVRIRALASILMAPGEAQDVEIPVAAFEHMTLAVKRIIITENKTNFLALPLAPETLIVWGGGYGLNGLGAAEWVRKCEVLYWGDIDSHGFAILNRLRSHQPHVRSVLMDQETLLDHQGLWGTEAKQSKAELIHLNEAEARLHAALLEGTYGVRLRLEQEQINWQYATERLGYLPGP